MLLLFLALRPMLPAGFGTCAWGGVPGQEEMDVSESDPLVESLSESAEEEIPEFADSNCVELDLV